MIGEWTILGVGLVYLGALFGVASYGDRMARSWSVRTGRPVIYALSLGALVAVIAVIGIVPYISIQLKAVSASLEVLISEPDWSREFLRPSTGLDGLSLLVALTMGIFAILFGTRHIDTTEHQDGMILAIAVESLVKLAASMAGSG